MTLSRLLLRAQRHPNRVHNTDSGFERAITETLSANGTYVYTTSFATVGSHTVLAAYVADATYAASTGSVAVNVTAVSSGSGTIALADAPSSLTVAQGSSANEAITVTPAGGYTGTVGLSFDTSNDSALQNLCCCGATRTAPAMEPSPSPERLQ